MQVMAADLSHQVSVATLVCDYRFFGGSDGTPRNLIDPVLAAEDMLAVLRHVRADPWFAARVDIDRLGLLGCSMGGGVACAAALQAEAEGIELMAVYDDHDVDIISPRFSPLASDRRCRPRAPVCDARTVRRS